MLHLKNLQNWTVRPVCNVCKMDLIWKRVVQLLYNMKVDTTNIWPLEHRWAQLASCRSRKFWITTPALLVEGGENLSNGWLRNVVQVAKVMTSSVHYDMCQTFVNNSTAQDYGLDSWRMRQNLAILPRVCSGERVKFPHSKWSKLIFANGAYLGDKVPTTGSPLRLEG